jgi:uncharacterized membrane protein
MVAGITPRAPLTIMHVELLILRLIHVLGGIFWVGSVLFTTLFLMPALALAGANPGQIMGALQRRGFMTVMPIVGLLTVGSGLRLLYITSGGFTPAFFGTPMGRALSLGGNSAILAFLISIFVMRRGNIRSARLGTELATVDDTRRTSITRELATLRRRGTVASTIVVVLLVLASCAMASARYLR